MSTQKYWVKFKKFIKKGKGNITQSPTNAAHINWINSHNTYWEPKILFFLLRPESNYTSIAPFIFETQFFPGSEIKSILYSHSISIPKGKPALFGHCINKKLAWALVLLVSPTKE